MKRSVAIAAVGALLLGLCLGTFATELTTGLALAAALALGDRDRLRDFAGPVVAVAAAFALAAATDGPAGWREVVGRAWPLAPLLALPALLPGVGATRERLETIGLGAAGLLGLAAVVERAWTGAAAAGPFTHHLTLGYALVPPLAVAVARGRALPAVGCAVGVLATGATGPLLSAVLAAAAARVAPPRWMLGGGVLLALGLIAAMAGDPALGERTVLWRAGAALAGAWPFGVGPEEIRAATAVAQDRISPGFHFPLHAHDSALQLGALVGLGGWLALSWLCWEAWQRTDRAGRAALAALAVGALTQDVLGDLEVVRAATAWVAWGAVGATVSRAGEPAAPGVVPAGPHPSPEAA